MQQNNNFSPLPFHYGEDMQANRMPYAYGNIFPLLYPSGMLPPFQVILQNVDKTKGITLDILEYATDGKILSIPYTDLTNYQYDEYIVLYSPVKSGGIENPKDGRYYAVLTYQNANGESIKLYSDVFTWSNNLTGAIKLYWWNIDNIDLEEGLIAYNLPMGGSNAYKNVYFLNTQIGKPDYEFTEEGEDRDGYFFAQKQLSVKKYKFTILANEAMCDALRTVRMSDYVLIVDQYGRTYNCTNFLITVKWETQGDLAGVECEFETNTVVKQIGRGYGSVPPIDFGLEIDKETVTMPTQGGSDTVKVTTAFDWSTKIVEN